MSTIPQQFACDRCHATQPVELLCAVRPDALVCAHCCHCPEHDVREIAGTVVFSGEPLTWRGLRP